MTRTNVLASVLLGLCLSSCAAAHLRVGHRATLAPAAESSAPLIAPNFTLLAHDGSTVSLEDVRRAASVVLVFYRGHWSPWCRRQLGELAFERAAFDARGVTLLGISIDSRDASVDFARDYDIHFPLLEDRGGGVSRVYVGVDADGRSLPGVVIVGTDGQVVFRQVGEGAADRVTSAELLAQLDAIRQPSASGGDRAERSRREREPPRVWGSGYSPVERAQLRLDLGAGAAYRVDASEYATFTGRVGASLLLPLFEYALLGPLVRADFGEPHALDVDIALKLRLPVLGDIAEVYLTVAGGLSTALAQLEDTGWNLEAYAGAQFAIAPSFAIYYELGATHHHFAPEGSREQLRFALQIGAALLF